MQTTPIVVAASLLLIATAHAASFDCRQARHPVEKIVCANTDLSALDDELAAAWQASQKACADPTQMRLHAQKAWMAEIRGEARYYREDQTQSRADAERGHAASLRDSYRRRIEAIRQEAEECKWLAAPKSSSVPPVSLSPLNCAQTADVVEKGMCLRDYVRKPAQQLHLAYASAVTTCADPQVHWRHPLAALIDDAKRIARESEERQGLHYTAENVELGNIHVVLNDADRPWNELKDFCKRIPPAERRPLMQVAKASNQLRFTIQRLGYAPGDNAVHLVVQDAKTNSSLLAIDLPNMVLTMEGESLLVNSARLYDDQGTINAGDFNFDGQDDFAVQVGQEGSYGGPNYAVFLRTQDGFVHSQRMSDLTREGLGFFGFDAEAKTLSTFSKSGCCDHWGTTYKVVNNQPVPVSMTRDVLGRDGMGRVEESVYEGGRWKKVKVQAYRPPEYCEEALISAGEEVLQGHRAKNYFNTPLCSLLPSARRIGVWFTLMPTLKSGQAQWGGGASLQGDWGVYMAVANTRGEGLLAQYANPAQFPGTYASSEASVLDAMTFARIAPDPVWALLQGLKGSGLGQSGEAAPSHERFNLFRWNQASKRIDNILVNLVARTEAGKTVILRKVTPLTTRHNGLSDLEVEEVKFAKPSQPGPLPADAQRQRWTLQFDGDRYPLPPVLTHVP